MLSHEIKDGEEPSMSPDTGAAAKSSEQPVEQGSNQEESENADLVDQVNHVENGSEEEDEEEDVDFNPLLKETPSREASSILSSEIDGLDADVADSGANVFADLAAESMATPSNTVQEYLMGDTDPGEEIVMQTAAGLVEEPQEGIEIEEQRDKMDESGKLVNADNDSVAGELNTVELNTDEEDAICMRTRARYSLASFTLDELETFLQGSDDEDDFQNVDDEAEYRKFLAAVLQGGDGDTPSVQESENVDDEDEENDADFELELEEALESENDEDARYDVQEETPEAPGHRPKTRQNRRKNALRDNKKLFGHGPLRPLLPYVPIMQRPAFATLNGTNITCNPAQPYVNDGSINGFTPHQIGQLHCLIHEHVQLLIQVFSVCVLEPSKRHIAEEVQELILEMHHQRENVLAWRRLPYPNFCFFPPCIHPSVPDEIPKSVPESSIGEASAIVEERRNERPDINMVPPDNNSSGKKTVGPQRDGQTLARPSWIPYSSGPALSVLDVAPLKLVTNFLNDVSAVLEDYRRRKVTLNCYTLPEKEELFPLINSPGDTEPVGQRDTACPTSATSHVSSDNNEAPKRTMASLLVEKAKKQSVVLVPKEIAQLARRFYPLFNPALYPHKPPPAAVANRILFTESEDQLLALGIMEYNSDWKAIRERFLPCKTDHQIFIRQKNRSSSRAPDNPIKAVRRMKTSPLTYEEVARIEEWMKVYKLDWMSIWKSVVPYRDPSLLPRQYRIAMGTQKSYKLDAKKKAKRKLYDLRRRNEQSAALAGGHSSPEKEDDQADKADEGNGNGDNQIEREDEAYVHEAFLADWRPGNDLESGRTQPPFSSEFPAAVRPMTNQVQWRPYRQRRPNSSRVVKLAPDLPPVNLPPSVRVMSQSSFASSQAKANSLSCSAGPSGVPRIPVNTSSSDRQLQDPVNTRKKPATERRDDSDLQMHPLLFQAPGDGHFPHYQLHPCANTLSPLNLPARSPPQLSLSLFHHPHHGRNAVNFLGQPYETDFHPLLKRSEATNSTIQLSQNLETSGGQLDQVQNPLRATAATSVRPVSSTEKSHELDLDIHLSFTTRRPNDVGIRASGGVGSVDPSRLRIHNANSSPIHSSQNVAVRVDRNGARFDSGSIVPRNEGITKNADDVEDQSLPGIVMEQEELSDSEDEITENVEFEREEMADSEAESESETEEMADTQNEGVEETETDADVADQHGTRSSASEDHCLNLNFCPPESPLMAANKEPSCSRIAGESISCIDDHFRSRKKAVNVEMQPSVEMSGERSSRKSRKHDFRETPGSSPAASNRKSRRLSSG